MRPMLHCCASVSRIVQLVAAPVTKTDADVATPVGVWETSVRTDQLFIQSLPLTVKFWFVIEILT